MIRLLATWLARIWSTTTASLRLSQFSTNSVALIIKLIFESEGQFNQFWRSLIFFWMLIRTKQQFRNKDETDAFWEDAAAWNTLSNKFSNKAKLTSAFLRKKNLFRIRHFFADIETLDFFHILSGIILSSDSALQTHPTKTNFDSILLFLIFFFILRPCSWNTSYLETLQIHYNTLPQNMTLAKGILQSPRKCCVLQPKQLVQVSFEGKWSIRNRKQIIFSSEGYVSYSFSPAALCLRHYK